MIEISNLTRRIGEKKIIDNLSLSVAEGEIVSFLGPNGCGKSTLMNILAGTVKADGGTVQYSKPVAGKIGFVFQDYRRHLLPWKTARENILFPLRLRGVPHSEQDKKLLEIVDLVGVPFSLNQKVYHLSGGQAQLVSLMRALIIEPNLLILDEPFSALDYQTTLHLQSIVLRVVETLKLTTLLISHNIEEAILMADKLVIFSALPAQVRDILNIDLPRPRHHSIIGSDAFSVLQKCAIQHFTASAVAI